MAKRQQAAVALKLATGATVTPHVEPEANTKDSRNNGSGGKEAH